MIKVDLSLRDYIYQKIEQKLQQENFHSDFNNKFANSYIEQDEIVLTNDSYLRTSQLTSCLRKEYFRILGYKPNVPPKNYLILQIGNDIHRRLQILLEDDLISKEEELVFDGIKFKIKGHYDGIIKYQDELSLIEIKSVSPFALDKILKEIAIVEQNYRNLSPDMQIYKYLIQANSYICFLKRDDIKTGWIILVNKASTHKSDILFTFKFWYDESLVKALLKSALEISVYLEEQTTPPPTQYSWECQYCFYINCDKNARNTAIHNTRENK